MPDFGVFSDAMARMERALGHTQALAKKFDEWGDGAYSIEAEFDAQTSENLLWVDLVQEPPRQEWGLAIGDILHNTRSALDNLVWALTALDHGPPPADPLPTNSPWRRLGFPILTKPVSWSQAEQGQLWGVDPSIQAIIKDAQPFVTAPQAPERELLALLHELWNIDKHRRIHLAEVFATLKDVTATAGGHPLPVLVVERCVSSEREGRAVIGRVRFGPPPVPLPPQTKVEMQVNLSLEIALDQGPPTYNARVVHTLKEGLALCLTLITRVIIASPHGVPYTSSASPE